jgi:hypothetical protein
MGEVAKKIANSRSCSSLAISEIPPHGDYYEDGSLLGLEPCGLAEADRRFESSYCIHSQGDHRDVGGSTHM